MIEQVEVGRHTDRRLLEGEPFRRPAIERVTRRRKHAFLHIGAGIEPQEFVGEIAVTLANGAFVGGRARRDGRRQNGQRADLAGVEPGKERHARLLTLVERLDQLARQDLPIDVAERQKTRHRRGIDQRLRIHLAQCPDVRRAKRGQEPRAEHLRRRLAELAFAQLGHRNHVGALRDRFREQPMRGRRGHQIQNAQPAGGLACDRHVRRIAAERFDIALNPFQRLDLIQHAVVAGYFQRRLVAELRMRQIAEHAETIVDRHDDDAPLRQARAVVERLFARATRKRAAVNPNKHRRFTCVGRRPDIQRQAIFARRADVLRVDALELEARLHARGPKLSRALDAGPRRHCHRRVPAAFSDRRHRIWNAFENARRAVGATLGLNRQGTSRRARRRTRSARQAAAAAAQMI